MLHSRLLSYLDEVVRAGSIRAAAGRLGIAASSINRQILALEEAYDVRLFERLPRRLRLTSAGELLIAHVRRTLQEEDTLRSRFVDLKGQRAGLVRIATIGGIVPCVMPALLDWVRLNSPMIKLVVRAAPLQPMLASVLNGEADLGVGYQIPANPKLQVLARVPSRLGVIMAPSHPLAERPHLSLSECVGYPMLLPDESLTIGVMLRDALARAAVSAERMAQTNSIELLRAAAAVPEMLAFLSEIEARNVGACAPLSFVPLHGPALRQELCLVARRPTGLDSPQSRIAEELRLILSRLVAT